MAKKNKKQIIVLEDVELRPQVIGYTFKKKSNLGRVIFIFIVFALVVYYINDVSVFIDSLLGRETHESIHELTEGNKNNKPQENIEPEIIYNKYENNLVIADGKVTFNNFSLNNKELTFEVISTINTKNNYYLETYTENKKLLERHKIYINQGNNESNVITLNITNDFYYIVIRNIDKDEYPEFNLTKNSLSCKNSIETINYEFKDGKLDSIEHTIKGKVSSESDIEKNNYYYEKSERYKKMTGIVTTFNSDVNGYVATFKLDLSKVDLSQLEEKYYYSYKEVASVVKFEMEASGFKCN